MFTSGTSLETVQKMKDSQIAGLNSEIAHLKHEVRELTLLNRRLVEENELLQHDLEFK